MSFLAGTAALIAAALTVPPLVALYFLKLRRRPIMVSSTLLWKKAIQDLQVNSPFQRIRKNLLLLLELLLLAALLLAFGRPTQTGEQVEGGRRLVLVIDNSGSMSAIDVSPSRLDVAKDQALRRIDSLEDGQSAMIVTYAQQAQVVQSSNKDRALLRQAIESIRPTHQVSRLKPALQLIEPFVLSSEGSAADDVTVLIFTDGRVHDEGDLALRGADLQFVRIGRTDDVGSRNLAFVAMSARRDYQQPRVVQVFAELANYSAQTIDANVTLAIDDNVQRVLQVSVKGLSTDNAGQIVPGREQLKFELELLGTAMVSLSHDASDDLAADNAAHLVIAPPRQLDVLLVTQGNTFLERIIDSAGARRSVVMDPTRYEQLDMSQLVAGGASGGFDLIVFDRYAPKQTPSVPSVSFGSAPPVPGLSIVPWTDASPKAQAILDWKRGSPILRYVAMDDLIVLEPGRLVLPDQAQVLATGPTGPMIAQVSSDGISHVIAGFDLFKSNWPMQVSFAVFVSNVMQGLGTTGLGADGGASLSFAPGDVASVPVTGQTQRVQFAGPVNLEAGVSQSRAVLPMFQQVGIYQSNSDVPPPWDRLPVNLLDPVESDLRPVERLQVATGDAAGSLDPATARREIWWWFALAALVLLMLEWLVYTRRMHL